MYCIAFLYVGSSLVLPFLGSPGVETLWRGYRIVKMVGSEFSAEWCTLRGLFRDLLSNVFVFDERAVSRPQSSFSLEDRGARPDFVM